MFIRFRQATHRLQASIVETRRVDGKVRHEHIASLGSIETRPTVADRIAFWQRINDRLAKLANRIEPATQGKIRGDLHARVPMVTPDEQRALQLENAEADERFWAGHRDYHANLVADHKGLVATAQRAIADGEVAATNAVAEAAGARERADRIRNGEDVAGGLGKPLTREDVEDRLLAAGMTREALKRGRDLNMLRTAGGEELFELFLSEMHKDREHAVTITLRRFLKKLDIESD